MFQNIPVSFKDDIDRLQQLVIRSEAVVIELVSTKFCTEFFIAATHQFILTKEAIFHL
jgi:hypothetical protein